MSQDKVLGGFEAIAPLKFGSERLIFLLTQRRVILAHVAKMGRRTLTLSGILGRLAGGLEKGSATKRLLEKMAAMHPDDILRQDQDNFAVDYNDVVSLTVEPSAGELSKIVLVTRDMKLGLSASLVAVEGLRELIGELLPGKALFRSQAH